VIKPGEFYKQGKIFYLYWQMEQLLEGVWTDAGLISSKIIIMNSPSVSYL